MIKPEELRQCMSMFATGVTVITTFDDENRVHGMSANSFASICLEPPLVLVCIGHETLTYKFMESQQRFGINVLSGSQKDVGKYFAKRPESRLGDVEFGYSISKGLNVPELSGALAFFGCQVVDTHNYGDHTIYIGEVKEISRGDGSIPLVFYQNQWFVDLNATG